MNTNEINYFAGNNPTTRLKYAGCLPVNFLNQSKIPQKFLPIGIVLNLCNSFSETRVLIKKDVSILPCHWIIIFIDKTNKIYYMDSAGVPSYKEHKEIYTFIKKQQKKLIFTPVQIQSEKSDLCGLFVLVYLWWRSNGLSHKSYFDLFDTKNLSKNDKTVKTLFKQMYASKRGHFRTKL
jgi:hypothetical protein